jgi:protein subunit release factor A
MLTLYSHYADTRGWKVKHSERSNGRQPEHKHLLLLLEIVTTHSNISTTTY